MLILLPRLRANILDELFQHRRVLQKRNLVDGDAMLTAREAFYLGPTPDAASRSRRARASPSSSFAVQPGVSGELLSLSGVGFHFETFGCPPNDSVQDNGFLVVAL